jgi:hypothetical protein
MNNPGTINAQNYINSSPKKMGDLGSSYWTQRSLFFLDGTIITVGENKYFKDRSAAGRNFLITGHDFDSTWTKGFPYKSAATISAPAGDATLIAADINNFLYDSGGTPNQIPVVSLFQNIDYENKIFCKHVAQVLDANGVEIYEPRVLEIFMSNSGALTGSVLTKANTYFNVPADTHTNGFIVALSGGDYVSPKLAAAAASNGNVTNIKTGTYPSETVSITNKGITLQGVGRCILPNAAARALLISDNTGNLITLTHLQIIGTGQNAIQLSTAVKLSVNKCRLSGYPIYGTVSSTDYTIKNSVLLVGAATLSGSNAILDTCLIPNISIPIISTFNLQSKNNRYLGSSSTLVQRRAGTTNLSFLGDKITGQLLTDEAIATECQVTVQRCHFIQGKISLVNAASKVSFTIEDSVFDEINTSGLIALKGYNIIFRRNITGGKGSVFTATGLADLKTVLFENNNCNGVAGVINSFTDYTVTLRNNILIANADRCSNVFSSTNYAMPCSIYNNYMVMKGSGGPFVHFGIEESNLQNDRFAGTKVYANRLKGPGDYGLSVGSLHGLFAWNQSAEWYYNYLSGSFLGLVLKSNGGTYANVSHHNVFKNCSQSHTIKGIKGTKIYNNTFFNAGALDCLSETVGGGGDSGGTVFKNNIVIQLTNTGAVLQFQTAANLTDVEIDYNIYYAPNAQYFALVDSPNVYVSFAEWQALGHDTHSIMLTEEQYNGLFNDPDNGDFSLKAGSVAIGAGVTLDAAYDDGLDASTNWGTDTQLPVVVTKQQGAAWDIGAYVH